MLSRSAATKSQRVAGFGICLSSPAQVYICMSLCGYILIAVSVVWLACVWCRRCRL
ncbi:unnamed protein product [Lathyrus oleraceus]